MDNSQGTVTVFYGIHDDPDGKYVIDLLQGLILFDHLFIDTEEMLHSAVHRGPDPAVLHVVLYFFHDAVDKFFPRFLAEGDLLFQIAVHIRLQIF